MYAGLESILCIGRLNICDAVSMRVEEDTCELDPESWQKLENCDPSLILVVVCVGRKKVNLPFEFDKAFILLHAPMQITTYWSL